MNKNITIEGRELSQTAPTFIIAEVSANHMQCIDTAKEIIKECKRAGADAVKIQTYTPETITLNCDSEHFQIKQETIWDGTTLYNLYKEAYMPWEWHETLQNVAKQEELIFFSTPFNFTAVDLLEKMDVPAYKISSFEINDIPLIKYVAEKKKPMLISTGVAKIEDISLALKTCSEAGNEDVALLKCTSAYPSPLEDMNLKTIPNMSETFDVIVGLSDHTLGHTATLGAIALGAKIIEKHVTLDRSQKGPDSFFSMEMHEFKYMVNAIRDLEKALGKVTYELTHKQKKSREHSRSLFVVEDVAQGEPFTAENVKSIRPAFGMHTKHYYSVLGRNAKTAIKKGTPLSWDLIQ